MMDGQLKGNSKTELCVLVVTVALDRLALLAQMMKRLAILT